MNGKERSKKSQKGQSQGFDEPPTQSSRQETGAEAEYEEAGLQSFATPEEGAEEEAAYHAAPHTQSGVDEGLLEIKSEIERQLIASAASGVVQAEDALEGSGLITGVGIGQGLPDQLFPNDALISDVTPGTPVLNVYVTEAVPVETVRAIIVESMGVSAASSDEVPINVVVTGVIDAQPHRFRVRPAPGGVSVGHFRITAGTLGCLSIGLHAPRNSRLMVLSNNHVLANSNSATFGDCITQPGPADGGRCPADQIAILERFVPINFSGGVNYVDCATGWAWPDRVRKELVYVSSGQLRYFNVSSIPVGCQVGALVGKTGRTTQLTAGRIVDCNATIRVNYGGGRVAVFGDQIVIRSVNSNPFSAGGDSGSLIWTWDARRNPVGLLFAGGGGYTIANKIGRVLSALDIRLVT